LVALFSIVVLRAASLRQPATKANPSSGAPEDLRFKVARALWCYRAHAMIWRVAAPCLVGTLALPALLLGSCAGRMPGPEVCAGPDACGKGRACVLGRCRPLGEVPAAIHARRLLFEPRDVAWLGRRERKSRDRLGEVLQLGKGGDGGMLVMRFALELPAEHELEHALLVLEPMPACERRPGTVELELAQVLSPWSSTDLERGRPPKLGVPLRAPSALVTPAQPLRLDVTELVASWLQRRDRYHGLALLASGDSPTGACFTTGMTWGNGPELHVFVRRPEKDAGSDADATPRAQEGAEGSRDAHRRLERSRSHNSRGDNSHGDNSHGDRERDPR
jgi:hypothetical protein